MRFFFEMKVVRVDVFCHKEQGGNPAGVVIVKQLPAAVVMQAAAQSARFPETVFAAVSNRRITARFFTPVAEVPLCGHAALALLSELYRKGLIDSDTLYKINCLDEFVTACVGYNGDPFLKMPSPVFDAVVPAAEIAPTLGLADADIASSGCRIVNAGLPDIFIAVRDRDVLRNLRPDFSAIMALSKRYACTGYHVYDETGIVDNSVYCRNFAPLVGIDEESATGTANSALAALLAVNGKLTADSLGNISAVFIQGMYMNSLSKINIRLRLSDTKISELWLSGKTKYVGVIAEGR